VLQLAAHCREGSLRRMARGILKAQGKPLVQPKDEILKRYRRTIDSIPAFYIGVPVEKASAVIRTIKGDIHLRFLPAEAPITVHNFLTMARGGYYDGILFHRVVPGFVAQAGCPRGDGWGGPGYTIPCENSDRTYRRGSLGMALAGKDTGGSQWFLCHRSVPHLDGRYTLFGEVSKGLDVLDSLVQGDVILSVEVR